MRVVVVLLCLLLLMPGLRAWGDEPEPPKVPAGAVFRPTFGTTSGGLSAGTAFFVLLPVAKEHAEKEAAAAERAAKDSAEKQPAASAAKDSAAKVEPAEPIVLLTALHLFGPSGGLKAQVPPAELPARVRGVELVDCFDDDRSLDFEVKALLIADAAPLGTENKGADNSADGRSPTAGQAGDIAAFHAPADVKAHVFELAPTMPKLGERIWLLAEVLDDAFAGRQLHAATLLYVPRDGDCIYEFADPNLEIRATSGAPILNQQGQVIAINIGGGQTEGKALGLGNPVTRFRPHLERVPDESVVFESYLRLAAALMDDKIPF
ncbi:MAG: hypothetical protein QM775_27445 [Pirellulales bacterium]